MFQSNGALFDISSQDNFQRGTCLLFLVASAYLLPTMAATGTADLVQNDWKPGTLAVAEVRLQGTG